MKYCAYKKQTGSVISPTWASNTKGYYYYIKHNVTWCYIRLSDGLDCSPQYDRCQGFTILLLWAVTSSEAYFSILTQLKPEGSAQDVDQMNWTVKCSSVTESYLPYRVGPGWSSLSRTVLCCIYKFWYRLSQFLL